jgi:hypothetical protein
MKPSYEELLETLFEVTQALRHTLVQAGHMSSADTSDGRSRTRLKVSATLAGTFTIGNS